MQHLPERFGNFSIRHVELSLGNDVARFLLSDSTGGQWFIDFDLITGLFFESSARHFARSALAEFRFLPESSLEMVAFAENEVYRIPNDGAQLEESVYKLTEADGELSGIATTSNGVLLVTLTSGFAVYYRCGAQRAYRLYIGCCDPHLVPIDDIFYRGT